MISHKKAVLLLTALLVPQASPAMSNFMSNVRDRMFGPRVQAPAGLIEQAREARIAAQKAERELGREIEVTGSATIATSNRYHQARDAQQWLDSEVERETRRAQKAAERARWTSAQLEADIWYRNWANSGPMWTSESDAKSYTAKAQEERAEWNERRVLQDFITRSTDKALVQQAKEKLAKARYFATLSDSIWSYESSETPLTDSVQRYLAEVKAKLADPRIITGDEVAVLHQAIGTARAKANKIYWQDREKNKGKKKGDAGESAELKAAKAEDVAAQAAYKEIKRLKQAGDLLTPELESRIWKARAELWDW